MEPEEIARRLAPAVARALGAARASLGRPRTMTGGATREAWSLDATLEWADGRREVRPLAMLVFRRGAAARAFSAAEEFRLLEVAADAGVPVPAPVLAGEEELGRPFYVMERVAGETIGRRLVHDAAFSAVRPRLGGQLASALATIHRMPVGDPRLAFLPRAAAGGPVAAGEVQRLEQLYRLVAVDPHPVFELAFRWLRARAPAGSRLGLVHGDFRIGNVIVDPERGLRAVLDWELAHVGDPLEDLGWICVRSWRFGEDRLACGGVAEREAFVSAYERESGTPVDRGALRFWELFGNLRWGVITLVQLRGFLDGGRGEVELAAIGRRAAETEWEILRLIEAGGG